MRTIKFRGKRIGNGEWVSGDLLQGIYGDVYIVITHENGVTKYEVQKETIGQFTGLHDKNGKEIYEGDIVKVKSLKGVVTWHPEGYFCIHTQKCDIAETSYNAIGNLVDWLHREHYTDGLEIIGNMHDNPDLMEGGENDNQRKNYKKT